MCEAVRRARILHTSTSHVSCFGSATLSSGSSLSTWQVYVCGVIIIITTVRPRKSAVSATAILCVRLSVCLSVRSSHSRPNGHRRNFLGNVRGTLFGVGGTVPHFSGASRLQIKSPAPGNQVQSESITLAPDSYL